MGFPAVIFRGGMVAAFRRKYAKTGKIKARRGHLRHAFRASFLSGFRLPLFLQSKEKSPQLYIARPFPFSSGWGLKLYVCKLNCFQAFFVPARKFGKNLLPPGFVFAGINCINNCLRRCAFEGLKFFSRCAMLA